KAHLLPTRRRLVGEDGRREQLARRAPQVADVLTGVPCAFVEANAGDEAVRFGAEPHTELDRAPIVDRLDLRQGRRVPDAARTDDADGRGELPYLVARKWVAGEILHVRATRPAVHRHGVRAARSERLARLQAHRA